MQETGEYSITDLGELFSVSRPTVCRTGATPGARHPVGLAPEGLDDERGSFMDANKETIEGVYADFAQGDVPAVLGAMAENIEWAAFRSLART